jgi:hypothetical protein
MATRTQANPRWVLNTNGKAGMEKRKVVADGSATWKAGQFLRIATDGLVYAATTSDGTADDFQYQALSDLNTATADETGATLQEVAVIDAGDVFEINELDGTMGRANVGELYIMNVTTNICTVDVTTAATNAVFEVVDVTRFARPYGPDADDTKARCTVKVIVSKTLQAARAA